jgi:hypothetical protein
MLPPMKYQHFRKSIHIFMFIQYYYHTGNKSNQLPVRIKNQFILSQILLIIINQTINITLGRLLYRPFGTSEKVLGFNVFDVTHNNKYLPVTINFFSMKCFNYD